MLKRSAKVAVVVGTLLVLLNQGDAIFAGPPFAQTLLWKVPLTYCVPFCVATYGALGNASR
ncbi:MAG: nitrate/nitrite transporter NrtS [Myxococcota bacterium]